MSNKFARVACDNCHKENVQFCETCDHYFCANCQNRTPESVEHEIEQSKQERIAAEWAGWLVHVPHFVFNNECKHGLDINQPWNLE